MPYQQFTKCVDAKDHNTQSEYIQATITAVIGGGIAALIALAIAGPSLCLLFVAPILGAIWIIAYCRWVLFDRLICLPDPSDPGRPGGSDQLAIGVVVDISPPDSSFLHTINPDPGSVDTDYSIGILLAPNEPGDTDTDKQMVEASVPYGFLVKEQPATHDVGLPFSGMKATDQQTGIGSWVLHCEFEGAGARDLMLAAEIALALAVAALGVCLFVPLGGLIIAGILAILSVLAYLLGIIVAHSDQASPADENPALGEIHANDGTGQGADILVIMGSWVYDTGHEGWNELHPVKFCERIGTWPGKWPTTLFGLEARWATAIGQATSTDTLENQQQPQNQWQVHPLLDGCQPTGVIV